MFDACRALRTFEKNVERPLLPSDLGSAHCLWFHRAKQCGKITKDMDFAESEILFMYTYPKAKVPLGANVLEQAVAAARSDPVPPEAERYSDNPKLQLLARVCFELQEIEGQDASFFISVRSAAKVIGVKNPTLGAAYLNKLVCDGFMRVTSKGGPAGNKATRFRISPAS